MLYKFKIKGIVCEIAFPKKDKKKGRVVIILPGLPEYPRPKKIIENMARKGYYVIYPRYRGTFESEGEFLKESPAKDIGDLISSIKNGEEYEEIYGHKKFKIPVKKITIIATSFGGSVALDLINLNIKIDKIILGSPVTDYKNHGNRGVEQDLKNLKNFLLEGFSNLYRFNPSQFDKLIRGDIISFPAKTVGASFPIYLVHGKKDKTISFEKSEKFARDHSGIKFISLDNVGHLSLSKLQKLGILDKLL